MRSLGLGVSLAAGDAQDERLGRGDVIELHV
jgi:hypothetical protein